MTSFPPNLKVGSYIGPKQWTESTVKQGFFIWRCTAVRMTTAVAVTVDDRLDEGLFHPDDFAAGLHAVIDDTLTPAQLALLHLNRGDLVISQLLPTSSPTPHP